jgi:hypothetical protein
MDTKKRQPSVGYGKIVMSMDLSLRPLYESWCILVRNQELIQETILKVQIRTKNHLERAVRYLIAMNLYHLTDLGCIVSDHSAAIFVLSTSPKQHILEEIRGSKLSPNRRKGKIAHLHIHSPR